MKIRDIAFALPSWEMSNEELAQWVDVDANFMRDKLGIRSRRWLGENESLTSLATAACEALFSKRPELDRSDIGLVALVTQNPDYRLPHSSALLQETLGLSQETAAFDVNLGCSGWVYALSIAKGLMTEEGIDDALVVTCDPYSRIMGRGDRDVVSLFGDAASATWLSSGGAGEIGRAAFGTDGSGAAKLMVQAGGSSRPLGGVALKGPTAIDPWTDSDYRLTMDGRAIFNFMMKNVPASVDAALERNGLTREDVDFFAFHQASGYMLDKLSARMGLKAERVPRALERYGNTVSSTIPIVLAELADSGRLRAATVVVSGFGVGLSWASNVVTFREEGNG